MNSPTAAYSHWQHVYLAKSKSYVFSGSTEFVGDAREILKESGNNGNGNGAEAETNLGPAHGTLAMLF